MQKTNIFGKKALWILLFVLVFSCSSPPPSYIILCAGDSLTEEGYPRLLNSLCRREGVRAKVLNYGRSGHTSGEYLGYLQKDFEAIARNRPDFICLQLGTNDVRTDHDRTSGLEFSANMKKIVLLFRDLVTRTGKEPAILLATIPPIPEDTAFPFTPESAHRVREEINPRLRRLAEEEGLVLVDNFSLFIDSPQLLPDVHPSGRGYEAMAQNWFRAMRKLGLRPVGKT